ncbi:MAG TPA: hypothetical protein VGG69_07680 [Rhizomicrobium sp.]
MPSLRKDLTTITGTVLLFMLQAASAQSAVAPPTADGTLGPAILSAKVSSDGSLVGGSGASSVQKNGTGDYRVFFVRDVRSCTQVASGWGPAMALVYGTEGGGPGNFVDVTTVNTGGGGSDQSFQLIVFCAS